MCKIVVRMPNWIGDLVMGLPILEDLREAYPEAYIAVICSGSQGDVLSGNPHVDEVISFSRKKRFFPLTNSGESLIKTIRKGHFDLSINLTNSFSSAWLFWSGNVRKRVGFFRFHRMLLQNTNVRNPKHKDKQHLVKTYKALLAAIGIEESSTKPQIYIESKAKAIGKTRIGINPGAAYGSAKCWLPERFCEVARRLVEDIPNVEVVLYGDKGSSPVVDKIVEGLPKRMLESGSVINMACKTTLKELIAEIAGLDAFLTNDSGPMHIAAALQTPLVALFGSTNDIATGPYKWGSVIHKRVECSPCYKRVCPIDFRCMKRIEVDEVLQEVKRALLVRPRMKIAERPSFVGAKEPKIYEGRSVANREMRVGTIILAAGMGRRLGQRGPKGCLEIRGRSFYETLLAKCGPRRAIMTSPMTHKATLLHLEEKGLNAEVFQSRGLPREALDYEESPEGNGAVFDAFIASGIFDTWDDVDLISVIPIDNILADPLNRDMIAACSELSVMAVERIDPNESVGILVEKEGKLHVAEYFEVKGEEGASWKTAYCGIFMCTKEFFKKAAMAKPIWHEVERSGGRHFERFALDAFPLASDYQVVMVDRERSFAPVKTKGDIARIEGILYNHSENALETSK